MIGVVLAALVSAPREPAICDQRAIKIQGKSTYQVEQLLGLSNTISLVEKSAELDRKCLFGRRSQTREGAKENWRKLRLATFEPERLRVFHSLCSAATCA
ncbi:hypothetical protein [Mesorhizobium sp. M0408]|uniref:hypothetical protein n=1 Tax=Mesorhizobium sp. M0408 TaxID=2956942 RepID=UPI0033388576